MSGLYLLALIAIWIGLTWLMFKGARRFLGSGFVPVGVRVVLIVVIAAAWFGWSFWEAGGKKLYWDAKVRELCAIDGGLRVFETVELPAEMFNRWGQPNFYRPNQGENALGADYIFRTEINNYRTTEPSISKRRYQVLRKEDSALLAEAVTYVRSGGDLPGPWHGSTYRCPENGGVIPLLVEIFKHQKEMEGKNDY